MKIISGCFLSLLLLSSCAPNSGTDYVQLQIPPELSDQPELVELLEKDAEILNDALNSLEDWSLVMVELGEEIAAIDENTEKEQLARQVKGKIAKLGATQVKMMLNLVWFSTHQFVSENSYPELFRRLSSGETIHIEKSIAHIKLNKELGEQKLKEFSDKFEELSKTLEEKKALFEKMKSE